MMRLSDEVLSRLPWDLSGISLAKKGRKKEAGSPMTTQMTIPPGAERPGTGGARWTTSAGGMWRTMGAIFFALMVSWVSTPLAHAQMGPSLQQQIAAIHKERQTRTPDQKKIHSQLLFAARQAAGAEVVAGVPKLRSRARAEADGRFKVRITAAVSPELLAAIQALGGTVLTSYPEYRAVYALMPVSKLEALAARADVAYIGIPPKPMYSGGLPKAASVTEPAASMASSSGVSAQAAATSAMDPEGDIAHGANLARAQYGVTGAGVKVGVMSDNIEDGTGSYAKALADGYVSTVTVPPGQSGGTTADAEGLAMLEVVHRIAPGAALYFATAGSGTTLEQNEEQMAENIKTLQADGCQIILDDVSYPDEDPFQDGIIAQAVDAVTAKGVLYFSCAANYGNIDSGNSSCWQGDFVSTENDGLLDFDASSGDASGVEEYNEVASENSAVNVFLFWAEPLGGATSQYDLYEVSPENYILQEADDDVAATRQPIQSLEGVAPGNYIAVELAAGNPRFLAVHIAAQNSYLGVATNGRAYGHNACDAPNSFSVAATPAYKSFGTDDVGKVAPTGPYPNEFNIDSLIEPFSDDGPRRMFFNPNGTAITPGNFSSTGGKVFAKPDFTAADGVTTSVSNSQFGEPFFGTSCAAPHAGALAALAMSYNPNLTPAQLAAILRGPGALKITSPSRDAGAGILMAPKILGAVAAASVPKIISFSPQSGPVGATVVITGTNFLAPLSVQFGGGVYEKGTFTLTRETGTVPAGAKTGPIKITTKYGSVSTAANFTVTGVATTYTVTPSAGADGTISPNTAQKVSAGGSVTFTATPAPGYVVSQWLLNGALAQTGGTSYTVTNVRANDTVKVTFSTASTTAKMTSPVPGSTFTSSSVTFKWSAAAGAAAYDLYVGSTQGASDIFNAGVLSASTLSQVVTGLPTNGSKIYVTLWTYTSGAWQYNSYTYTAANAIPPPQPSGTVAIPANINVIEEQ